jgi:hypothetical protein
MEMNVINTWRHGDEHEQYLEAWRLTCSIPRSMEMNRNNTWGHRDEHEQFTWGMEMNMINTLGLGDELEQYLGLRI